MKTGRQKKVNTLIEYLESFGFALSIVVLVFVFLLRIQTVSGKSMYPTLKNGDRIAVSCVGEVEYGDIVVIDGMSAYGAPLVKRVIGMEGDTLDVNEIGQVMRNGELLDESYLSLPTNENGDVSFPVTVEKGKLFVMGDNRPYSKDSRNSEIGQIDRRDVFGKVFFRILPFDTMGGLE